jgi:hypothetical protein
MRRALRLLAVVIVLVWIAGCTRQKADTVLVVGADGVSVHGKAEMVLDGDHYRPNVWIPGNIVIFRVSEDLAGQKGEKGGIYRINKDKNLERIGTADLKLSDEELASKFGIKPTPASK